MSTFQQNPKSLQKIGLEAALGEDSPLVNKILDAIETVNACYFYMIDINEPKRYETRGMTDKTYTLRDLSQHITPEERRDLRTPQGTFKQILRTRERVVFFFEFEKHEMRPASRAVHTDFTMHMRPLPEDSVLPRPSPGGISPLRISTDVSVFTMAPAEVSAVLHRISVAHEKAKAGRAAVMQTIQQSTGIATAEGIATVSGLIGDMVSAMEEGFDNAYMLRHTFCGNVTPPEILTIACLAERVKEWLGPESGFVVSTEGGADDITLPRPSYFSRAATTRDDLRIYHERYSSKAGTMEAASVSVAFEGPMDDDDILMGCAMEAKRDVGTAFSRFRPQLLRNMERVATDLAYKAVKQDGMTFTNIRLYGGILDIAGSVVEPSLLEMDFICGSASLRYGKHPLPVDEFFTRVVNILRPTQ